MSLVIETIKQFAGFGAGGKPSEYYYSQGMNRSRFGVSPGWKAESKATDATLTTLNLAQWFTQGQMGGEDYLHTDMYVAAVDTTGRIYRSKFGTDPWELFYRPPQSPTTYKGNGLIFDQKQRLLFAGVRWLGFIDPLSDDNEITGTIAVTNGSPNVVGTGTTFQAGMAGKHIRIGNEFYTINTFTDATHISLTANYAGTTASGLAFRVFVQMSDQFKDFGTDFATLNADTALRPSDTYEDWVLWGNGNTVAVLNITDDSWNPAGFEFPQQFYVSAIKSGRTGVLLGANFNNQGVIALWDAQATRSLAPWIWFNAQIRCIKSYSNGWLVFTTRGIYVTNGYTAEPFMPRFIDTAVNDLGPTSDMLPQGAEVVGEYLAFWGTGQFNRSKYGIYLMHLETGLLEFCPVANGATYGVTPGAIFFDSGNTTHISYVTDVPARKVIGALSNSIAEDSQVVFEAGANSQSEKVAQAVKLNLGIETRAVEADELSFTVAVKTYNFKRLLWNRSLTAAASGVADQLRVDGTLFQTPERGDEVTILHGLNAGQVRHITSISSPGTLSETWTLDSALASLTEMGIELSVMPFELVKKHTITGVTSVADLFFDVKNRMKGKRFLVKVLIEGVTTVKPEIQGAQLVYDDLGPLTSK